jgi:hypothetical protein
MKYYSYDINYDEKNGSMGVVMIDTNRKQSRKAVLKHLQDEGEVEEFNPRDFDCEEITQEEYEEEMGIEHIITIEELRAIPHETFAQKKKWVQKILEYYNQEAENETSRSEIEYIEGKRDGYSSCLNDLFGTGNAS